MNKQYSNYLFFCLFLIITVTGCNKKDDDNTCLSFTRGPVITVEGANFAAVNQEIILTVYYGCYNGCGQFGNFEEITTGNTTTIKVNAKYEGCICTQDAPIRPATYKFKKSTSGIFDLKFEKMDNTFLTHSITVQ